MCHRYLNRLYIHLTVVPSGPPGPPGQAGHAGDGSVFGERGRSGVSQLVFYFGCPQQNRSLFFLTHSENFIFERINDND